MSSFYILNISPLSLDVSLANTSFHLVGMEIFGFCLIWLFSMFGLINQCCQEMEYVNMNTLIIIRMAGEIPELEVMYSAVGIHYRWCPI